MSWRGPSPNYAQFDLIEFARTLSIQQALPKVASTTRSIFSACIWSRIDGAALIKACRPPVIAFLGAPAEMDDPRHDSRGSGHYEAAGRQKMSWSMGGFDAQAGRISTKQGQTAVTFHRTIRDCRTLACSATLFFEQMESILNIVYPALIAAAMLGACAKAPEKIAAADIGANQYTGYNCKQLAETKVKHDQNLANLSAAQKDAQDADAMGVFLLGLPLSSMSGGDKETAIAVTKGHIQAIELAQTKKGCTA